MNEKTPQELAVLATAILFVVAAVAAVGLVVLADDGDEVATATTDATALLPTTDTTPAPTTVATTVSTTVPTTVATTVSTTVPTTVATTAAPTTAPTTVATTAAPTTAPTTVATTAAPTTAPTTVPTTAPTTTPATSGGNNAVLAAAEAESLRLLNELRVSLGLHPLANTDAEMNAFARAWALDMRHNGFRHSDVPWGENIVWWSRASMTPAEAAAKHYDQWINSPGHYRTMIDPKWTVVGVGMWNDESGWWGVHVFR